MAEFGERETVFISDEVDSDGDVMLEVNREAVWLSKVSAEQIVRHLEEVFDL